MFVYQFADLESVLCTKLVCVPGMQYIVTTYFHYIY